MSSIYETPHELGSRFFSKEEHDDLIQLLDRYRGSGAISVGVFGSICSEYGRNEGSDIDVLIITKDTEVWGDITSEYGERSGTHFHIFFKRPGYVEGNNRRAEILNEAEANYIPYF